MANEMMGQMSPLDFLRSNQFQYGLMNTLAAAQPQYAIGQIPHQVGPGEIGLATLGGMQQGRQLDLRNMLAKRAQQTGYLGLMDDPQAISMMGEMSPEIIIRQATALQAARAKAAADAQAASIGFERDLYKTQFTDALKRAGMDIDYERDLAKAATAHERDLVKADYTSRLKDREATGTQKDLTAAGLVPGSPEYRDAILKHVTKPQVSVDQRGSNKFAEKFSEYNAKSFFDEKAAAQDAQASLRASIDAKDLLDKGIITGFGADVITSFGRALQQAGFRENADPVANTQAFVATRAMEVGRIIKLFGAGTGLSDADREYATKAAAGQITMTEGAIRKVLDIHERVAKEALERYNAKASKIPADMSPWPLTLEVPKGGKKTSTGVNWTVEEDK